MSGGFPLRGSHVNPKSSGAGAIGLALPASANTKGAYTTLFASTTYDASYAYVTVDGKYNSSCQCSIDLAIGGAGSEQIILADLMVLSYWIPYTTKNRGILIPVCIPQGTRVSARCQMTDISSSNAPAITLTLYDGDFVAGCGSAIDTIGFNSGTTKGTSVTPGNAVKGSYSQLIASTAYDYDGFFLAVDPLGSVTQTNAQMAVDVAIGGAGSEKIIVADWNTFIYNNNQLGEVFSPFFHAQIPAGSRIAARTYGAQGAVAIGLTFYGVRK